VDFKAGDCAIALSMPTMRQPLPAAAALASLLLSACGGEAQQNRAAANGNAADQQAATKLPIPVPEPPLGREQLLTAALKAASAFATGASDEALQKSLDGKKFEFRIRFGCDGPGEEGAGQPFDWTYDKATGALKVRATPALSPKDPPIKALAGEAFETVEGFWVRRPWLMVAACPINEQPESQAEEPANGKAAAAKPTRPKPTQATDSATGVSPPQLVGIAQFFTATGPRTMRRSGRPYEATKRLEDAKAPEGGFDLVLSGRLAPLPNGRVIACTRATSEERPACVISVEFGKVSIERADTHEQLAQWGSG
jgi:hypothetical protein